MKPELVYGTPIYMSKNSPIAPNKLGIVVLSNDVKTEISVAGILYTVETKYVIIDL